MKKRIGILSACLLVVLLAAYFGISYLVYDKLSRITPGGGENAGNTPASFVMTYEEWPGFDVQPFFMTDYETVRIPSRQPGIELAGWYVPGRPDAPAILVTHGVNGWKGDPNVLVVAGMLHRNGFNVLLFDLRNHGASDIDNGRAALGNKEYLDLLGAWDWLISIKQFAPDRIGVYGESFGAGTTLIAFSQEPRIAAAFLDSPYADLKQIMQEELSNNGYPPILAEGAILMARVVTGDDLLGLSPQAAIQNHAGRPLFIVHGTGDRRVNVHHTQQLVDLAAETGANVEVWMPADIRHVAAEFDLTQEYEQRLVQFFTQVLSG